MLALHQEKRVISEGYARVQDVEKAVVQEETTVPGEAPGIYACDYKKLAQIMVKTAEARLALMQGDAAGAEVSALSPVILHFDASPLLLSAPCHPSSSLLRRS